MLIPSMWAVAVTGIAATSLGGPAADTTGDLLEWSRLEPIPASIGLGGAIAGIHDGVLIVAGGANFPDTPRWETPKVWHDAIYTLALNDSSSDQVTAGTWRQAEGTLPTATAYAVSLSHPVHGVIVVGGSDGTHHLTTVLRITSADAGVAIEELPPLARPLAYAAGGLIGEVIYVIGGQESADEHAAADALWQLDLAAEDPSWMQLPSLPGAPRILPVVGVAKGHLFVFSGAELLVGDDGTLQRRYLTDTWSFDPETQTWTQRANLPWPVVAAPTPAINLGHDMMAIIGGDDGSTAGQSDILKDDHPGFSTELLTYHVITDAWSRRGEASPPSADQPAAIWSPVTATVVPIDGGFVIPSGEVRPRVRSAAVHVLTPIVPGGALASLDWIVIAIYLLSLVAMGFYFSRREESTDDFFLAGRRIPWWAAGISIFATQLSAITFMAIPAKAYETDWVYFVQSIGIFLMAPVVAYLFLPFYRRLNLTTAYEYLERRFSLLVRLLGSGQFILAQVGRVAVVVFLPALALSAVTGIDVTVCIGLMGLLAIIYTVLGGIEVVIWSDVLQTAVLLGGAVVAAWIMIAGIPGGLGGAIDQASAVEKLRWANLEFDLTEAVLLVVLFGAIFNNIIPYTADQAVIQRYLTTPDEASARRALWTGGILAIPASILFFGLGTLLYVYYHANPDQLGPTNAVDQILPWFIVHQMPAGISGLVIAGIFAAAMSSIDSSMNSVSTAFTTDFYRRFRPEIDDRQALRVARWVTVIFGVIGTAAALLIATLDVKSVLDLWFQVLGLFASGLCGLFFLGIFWPRAGAIAAIGGLVASAIANFVVGALTDLNVLLISTVGISSCVLTGVALSFLWPNSRETNGLTWRQMPPETNGDR